MASIEFWNPFYVRDAVSLGICVLVASKYLQQEGILQLLKRIDGGRITKRRLRQYQKYQTSVSAVASSSIAF
jgi:hypothetical protein